MDDSVNSIKDMSEAFKTSLLNSNHLEQRGILRSNCIDCLDRTNVAQVSFNISH